MFDQAEEHFQRCAWMGLRVGASNAAWLLRRDKRAPVVGHHRGREGREVTEGRGGREGPVSREDHAFGYSVMAAQQGDLVEHVAMATALSNTVRSQEVSRVSRKEEVTGEAKREVTKSTLGEKEVGKERGQWTDVDYWHGMDRRRQAVLAWEGASVVGSSEATVELGLKYVWGDEALAIGRNETRARVYLNSCVNVFGQSIHDTFSVECLPAQLLLWWLDGKDLYDRSMAMDVAQEMTRVYRGVVGYLF